jgi:hypothetical protein
MRYVLLNKFARAVSEKTNKRIEESQMMAMNMELTHCRSGHLGIEGLTYVQKSA